MIGDLLTRRVDATTTGLFLSFLAIVTFVWGTTLIAATCRREPWRAWFSSFDFLLGAFLLVSDTGLYGLLGVRVLLNTAGEDGVPVWAATYFTVSAAIAMAAFVAWSRSQGLGGEDS